MEKEFKITGNTVLSMFIPFFFGIASASFTSMVLLNKIDQQVKWLEDIVIRHEDTAEKKVEQASKTISWTMERLERYGEKISALEQEVARLSGKKCRE